MDEEYGFTTDEALDQWDEALNEWIDFVDARQAQAETESGND